jgi:hypothetical protein
VTISDTRRSTSPLRGARRDRIFAKSGLKPASDVLINLILIARWSLSIFDRSTDTVLSRDEGFMTGLGSRHFELSNVEP